MKQSLTRLSRALAQPLLIGPTLCVLALAAHASCNDDLLNQVERSTPRNGARGRAVQPAVKAPVPAAPAVVEAPTMDPQLQLQTIAREAVRRSAQVGAVKLLVEAAQYDVDETRGAGLPQVNVGGTIGPGTSRYTNVDWNHGLYASASVNMTGLLYDGGRNRQLTEWRRELAGAAKFSLQTAREQVVLEAVSTALERNRYRLQAQVYQQYVRKMSCLVDALQEIVSEDRGRASELVQARKTQAQAELQRDSALALSRQVEIRLRKLIGDQAPPSEGISSPLTLTQDVGEVLRLAEQNNELRQLRAQADASDRYAKAIDAGQQPQVNWVLTSTGAKTGDTKSLTAQAGISVSYSVFNGGSTKAAATAAARRAESARQQYDEYMNTRVSRIAEVHDSALTSFDRAKRYVEVLKDSDKVRSYTFQQWSQLGRRSLFDVMSAEGDHFNLRIAYVNSLYDGYQANAQLRSIGAGLVGWLVPDAP
ncbi:MAG TPA: TolC family protein [Candidatus Aquabacterium excrementipullorum]|nr:TolC family protein [Candidatus Aquabacterium excrementipullorum]